MAIFNSYVSLPEGTQSSHVIPIVGRTPLWLLLLSIASRVSNWDDHPTVLGLCWCQSGSSVLGKIV
jgi:hypothetical protein